MDVFALSASISLNLDNFNTNLDKAQKKFKSFSDNISGLSGKIDSVYKGMGDVLKPAVDGFKAVEGVGKKAGNAVTTGLKGFAAAATAVGGFGAAAAKSGMQFDATMSEVSAISGAVGDEFDALRDKALEMGAKTKFSASEAGEAMTYMAMAGWKTGDMLGSIEGIMNLAAASGEDLASTSDIVTDAMTAFGMAADGTTKVLVNGFEKEVPNASHFADILAAASSNANTNVGLMGETFKYTAPLAGAMGYTAEDTALAIGLMANAGIKGSQSGTALRSIMTRLAKPTKESATAMDALGISITNSDGSMKPFGTTISELRTAFSGLSEEQKATYAAMLGGQEAMSGLLAIVNAAPADVEKLTNALNDCNGAAEEMAATMVDNLQGDLTLLGSAFESLQIAISDSLTPTLREFAQFGQKAMANLLEGFQGNGVSGFMSALSGIVTDGVKILAEKAPEFASVSLQFVQAIGTGLIDAAPEVLTAAGGVVDVLVDGIFDAAVNHGNEINEVGKNIIEFVCNGFSQATEAIGYAIDEFMPLLVDGFLSYHETLFNAGIEILRWIGRGISNNKEEIQEAASETITNMVTALIENAPDIIEGGLALLEALVGAIEENMPLILAAGSEIVSELIAGISTASPGVQAIIGVAILPHILKIVETVGSIGGAVSSVASLASGAINTVIGIGGKLMGGIKALFGLIAANPVVAIITGIVAAVVLLYAKCEWFRDAVHAVIDAVAGFFKGAWDLIVSVWNAAGEFFGGIVEGIKSVFDGISEFLGGLFKSAWEMVQGAWDAAAEFFAGIGNGIREAFEAVTSFLGDAFISAWDAVSGAWEAATGFFGDIWDSIKGAAEETADKIGKALSDAWDAVTSAWDGAMDFFGGLWDGVKGVFADAWDAFTDIGGNIVKGIWNGITGLASWLTEKVTGFFGGIVDGVKGMLGIHSPSRVFAGIGENMALGLAEGWDDEYNSIKRQIESGLNFGAATVGVSAAHYGAQEAAGRARGGWGNTTVNIYSPEAVDGVQAARVWRKETQKMAVAYI